MQESQSPPTTESNTPQSTEHPQIHPEKPMNKAALGIVFLVVFIDLLGFGIVMPLLPKFGKEYVSRVVDHPILVGVVVGLLFSAFSLMQFIFNPLWGRISDQVGRRPIMLLGLASSVIFYGVLGYALGLGDEYAITALGLLFVSRIGAGIAGATIATAQAAIADSTPPEKRKVGMALIGAAFGIGFTFGPLVGYGSLRLFQNNPEAIGYSAAGLSLVAFIVGLTILPETRKFGTVSAAKKKWFSWKDTREVLSTPTVGMLVLVFFLTTVGFSSFEPTLALLNQEILKMADDQNFLVFAYIGLVLLFTQGYLYRKLAHRFSELTFMTVGMVLMGLGLAFLGGVVVMIQIMEITSWNIIIPLTLLSLTVAVVGFAFLTPSIQSLISRRSDPERQGEILGVNQSASAMARILGPMFGLALFYIPGTYHLLPYVFGAVVLLSMLMTIPSVRQK